MSGGKNLARLALARYHLQQAYDLFDEGSSARYNMEPLMEQLDRFLPNYVAEVLRIEKAYEEALRSYEYFQNLQEILHPIDRYETVTQTTNIDKGYGL